MTYYSPRCSFFVGTMVLYLWSTYLLSFSYVDALRTDRRLKVTAIRSMEWIVGGVYGLDFFAPGGFWLVVLYEGIGWMIRSHSLLGFAITSHTLYNSCNLGPWFYENNSNGPLKMILSRSLTVRVETLRDGYVGDPSCCG